MSRKIKFRDADENLYGFETGDVSDSEEEYSKEDKRLLEKVRKKRTVDNYDSEDEVYGLHADEDVDNDDDDDGSDSMKSDIEGLQEDDDLPNEKAWGNKKSRFHSTDYVDQDYASTNQQDLEAAELEEQEARNIQKRLAEQLDDADFGLDLLETKQDQEENEDCQQTVKTDLSKLTKREKQALFMKESPEFTGLVTDLKECLTEARDILEPFLKLIKNGKFSESAGLTFVRTKYHVILNYCTNILYYLMLKADRVPVNSHPVIKRLAQYRQLLNQLKSGQGELLEEAVEILKAAENNQSLYNLDNVEFDKKSRKRPSAVLPDEQIKTGKRNFVETVQDEKPIEQTEDENSEVNENADETENQGTEVMFEDVDGKRAITRQIAKNKGLTPHRRKDLRNPRVKLRNKYRKAKIRRKGAVREVRKEETRYGGETFGINARVKKSIKLK
ncbi:something about silencing protein 10 isoform X1 [Neodiprion pinetum]|uniref:Something about silencing protein 10 n=2 Tax=Neodiprion TaxID=270857 RepID=A0A6J0B6F0_NEOLC|nr:something about silencing protein 10 [Neodiprion lecontei]XP_046480574.1 something about silencing protein 10 [Neodiprion pinetum]